MLVVGDGGERASVRLTPEQVAAAIEALATFLLVAGRPAPIGEGGGSALS